MYECSSSSFRSISLKAKLITDRWVTILWWINRSVINSRWKSLLGQTLLMALIMMYCFPSSLANVVNTIAFRSRWLSKCERDLLQTLNRELGLQSLMLVTFLCTRNSWPEVQRDFPHLIRRCWFYWSRN